MIKIEGFLGAYINFILAIAPKELNEIEQAIQNLETQVTKWKFAREEE